MTDTEGFLKIRSVLWFFKNALCGFSIMQWRWRWQVVVEIFLPLEMEMAGTDRGLAVNGDGRVLLSMQLEMLGSLLNKRSRACHALLRKMKMWWFVEKDECCSVDEDAVVC
jgi:hypothetical protein